MERLQLRMYDNTTDSGLFGLVGGQSRSDRVIKNAGWFNAQARRIGSGDLSAEDMVRISQELEEDELFVVLGEGSCMCFIYDFGRDVDTPGLDVYPRHIVWLIARNRICFVDSEHARLAEVHIPERFPYERLSEEEASTLVSQVNKQAIL